MTLPIDRLRWAETVRFDPKRLDELCVELGEDEAERIIAESLAQITTIIEKLDTLRKQQDLVAFIGLCRGLARVAGHVGMTTLAGVARDVRICAEAGDRTALAATYGRLTRISDHSVHAIWSLEDISG